MSEIRRDLYARVSASGPLEMSRDARARVAGVLRAILAGPYPDDDTARAVRQLLTDLGVPDPTIGYAYYTANHDLANLMDDGTMVIKLQQGAGTVVYPSLAAAVSARGEAA